MITLADITTKVPAATLATKDIKQILDAFNLGRIRVESRLGGIGLIMETLGADAGAALLDQLSAASATIPALKWAFILINRGELDFGSAATHASLDTYTPPAVAAALKAVAEVPDPVTESDLVRILLNPDGTWRI